MVKKLDLKFLVFNLGKFQYFNDFLNIVNFLLFDFFNVNSFIVFGFIDFLIKLSLSLILLILLMLNTLFVINK